MSESDVVINIIHFIYYPADIVLHFFIFFAESAMFTLTVSMLIISLGKILTTMERKFYKYLKWTIYTWFIGYGLYTMNFYSDLFGANLLDWSAVMFSIVAPICMIIVFRQASNIQYKGHKPFKTYILIMLIYLCFAIIWFIFFPLEIMFGWWLVVWVISLFFTILIGYIKGN